MSRRLLLAAARGGASLTLPRYLSPLDTITATKNGGNPTFNFDAIPESIVKVGSTYWCVYMSWAGGAPHDVRLASSTSPAGPWTAYGSNPIYDTGDVPWFPAGANDIYAPEIIEVAGTFYLFYSVADVGDGSDGYIGVATASAVTGPYTDHGSAILSPGSAGAWDSRRVAEPSVFYLDGTWVMAYMAETTVGTFGLSEKVGIATASSPTGPWTKASGNPLIDFGSSGAWDDVLIADPFIWYEAGLWWVWYSGGGNGDGTGTRPWSSGLAYATDPEGPWTKHASNPILSNGTTWEEKAAWRGSVYRASDGTYHIVYGGLNSDLSVAKGGNAVLVLSDDSSWFGLPDPWAGSPAFGAYAEAVGAADSGGDPWWIGGDQGGATIERYTFSDRASGHNVIVLDGVSNLTIQDIDFDTIPECIYMVDCSNVTIRRLRARNIYGPFTRTAFHSGNLIQMTNCSDITVQDVKVVQPSSPEPPAAGYDADVTALTWGTEDIISMGGDPTAWGNVTVERFAFDGGGWLSPSGTGLFVGDGASGHDVTVQDGILLNPAQCAIGTGEEGPYILRRVQSFSDHGGENAAFQIRSADLELGDCDFDWPTDAVNGDAPAYTDTGGNDFSATLSLSVTL